MKCPRCQQENPSQAKFCLECGAPVSRAAPDSRSHVDLNDEVERLSRALSESVDQQAVTSEILRVISRSQTDVQPVFDAIVHSAVRLCDGVHSNVFRFDGKIVHWMAGFNLDPEAQDALRRHYPRPPDRGMPAARAVLDGSVVHIVDVLEDPDYVARDAARLTKARALLSVPMLRDGKPIGAITVARREPRPFSGNHIDLLETFADQAVIAIENVRLFTELQVSNRDLTETLEQQMATAEILRAISSARTDAQPVFEAIVRSAVRLCHGFYAVLYSFDGEWVHARATHNMPRDMRQAFGRRYPMRAEERRSIAAVSMAERRMVRVRDMLDDAEVPQEARGFASVTGFRSYVAVPMLRDGRSIGAVSVARREVEPFTDKEIALLQTFADQAVIAIENGRLFGELEARTQELTRSVEQLTALGEVGRAVSSTLDLGRVLTTIVSRAVQLSGMDGGVVFEYDDAAEEFIQRVATEASGSLGEARRVTRTRKGEGVLGRTAVTLEPAQVPDITVPGAYEGRLRETLIGAGIRAILAVPMVYEGRLIGGLAMTRNRAGEFPGETIDLLRTFATQSALAIQNARLFREIEDKSRQLEAASRHKSEFLANMSHELRTPLNAIIGFSEVLGERMFGELNEKQEEYLKDIHASGQHLLSLINDILDLSKIEAGRMELELSEFDVPAAIDNALTLVRERAARHGIALHRAVDAALGQIRGDERKIRQVVLNLLSNAIKFTPAGGRIEIRAAPGDGFVEVSVSDTGLGIAPEDQGAIFEEFRQVGTVAKQVEGTGLGLALSRKFIELHGGRIWVESQMGAGSRFAFTLPVRPGA